MKSFVIFLRKIKFKRNEIKLRKSKKLFTQSELSVLVCMAISACLSSYENPENLFLKWSLAIFHSLQIIQIQFVRLDGDFRGMVDLSVGFGCVKIDIYIYIYIK